jgi:MoaA/NifB/PqqE/SkfB family radical SAM enzyme
MTADTFQEILDRFPEATGVTLTGGEPLLHPQLFELVRLAHARRMEVRVPTNGTLLAKSIDALLKAPIDRLNVSFYGADAQSFSVVTGADAGFFEEVTGAVAELASFRTKEGYPRVLQASYICTKETMYRAVDFVRLCEKLGVDRALLLNLLYFGIPDYSEAMCLHKDDPEVQRFVEHLDRQSFRIPVLLPKLYERQYIPATCTMPFGLLTIDGDGNIGPCCIRGPSGHWGNLFESPDVWNGPTMMKARRDLLDPAASLPVACLHCEEMIPERRCLGSRE